MINFGYLLGFLGLLGIAVLILIYLLKPNYQQKVVSSTFVWKLSLKYRKKRLPVSRLRNLLIIICQILIITFSSFLLAQPYLAEASMPPVSEKIIIIDASASMLAHQNDDVTRFERAVSRAKTLGQNALNSKERVTLIIAGQKAETKLYHVSVLETFNQVMDALVVMDEDTNQPVGCTYGAADVDGAMTLTEGYFDENPSATAIFYTATDYRSYSDLIEVENVARLTAENGKTKEWNAAILDVTSTIYENYYRFDVKVARYNDDNEVKVYVKPYGVNGADANEVFLNSNDTDGEGKSLPYYETVACADNNTFTIRFYNLKISSYNYIHFYIDEADSFAYDNEYYLYDGEKETLSIIYVSESPSNFYSGLLSSLFIALDSKWDIKLEVTSLTKIATLEDESGIVKELKGYDLYIFEYDMPDTMPDDGAVFLMNPYSAPENLGITFDFDARVEKHSDSDESCILYAGESSQIMNLIDPSKILVREYNKVISYEDDFKPLMYAHNVKNGVVIEDPVFLVKNTTSEKVAVATFPSLYSDLTVSVEFATLMYNVIDCFFPATLSSCVYDVGQELTFNQRNAVLNETKPVFNVVKGTETEGATYNTYPYAISASRHGTYTISQDFLYSGTVENGTYTAERTFSARYFVKIAATESDITRVVPFTAPSIPDKVYDDLDIFIYFAAALLALLFIERVLHTKDEF